MRSCICVYDPAQDYKRRVCAHAGRTLVCRIASSSSATQPRAWCAERDFGGASEILVKTSVETSALRSEGAPKCAMARRKQDAGKRSRLSKTWKHAQRFFSPFSVSPAMCGASEGRTCSILCHALSYCLATVDMPPFISPISASASVRPTTTSLLFLAQIFFKF
jgi:hypothetical protein